MSTHISADTLIPGKGAPIRDGKVVIDRGQIQYAGPREGAPPVVEGDISTTVPALMPGIWEAHGHFLGFATADLELMATADPLTLAARATADAAATLNAGVTSVREAGGIGLSLKPVIEDGTILGPRIYGAGRSCPRPVATPTFTACHLTTSRLSARGDSISENCATVSPSASRRFASSSAREPT